jgi:hypothetical protein
VQKRSAQIESGSDVTASFVRANKAGSVIIAFVVWDGADGVTLDDGLGNDYVSAVGPTAAGGDSGLRTQIFYARNPKAGANSVTAHFSSPVASHAALYVHEYTGLGRALPFDAASAVAGTSPEIEAEPLATSASGELVFVGIASDSKSVKRLTPGTKVRARKRGELTADRFGRAAGKETAVAVQSGTGWVMQLASFAFIGPTPAKPQYPLRRENGRKVLVDQAGAPFLMTGDSPQALMVNLSESEAAAFFANRKRRGFNAVWINLLCASYTGGRPDASTYDGIRPFTSDLDLSTPNEAYFARVDHMLRLAAQNGLLVLLDPAETGSFLEVLRSNGVDKARDYGRYLGTRYRGFDNIVWMSGNDFQLYTDPEYDAAVQAVARGIHDTDELHIHTVELNLVSSLEDPSWAPLIQLNATYTYGPTYAKVLEDYNRPDGLPTFMVEATYEFENAAAGEPTPEIIRRQAYWSLLSGAAGQFYGNHYTWPFVPGWKKHLDTPGSTQMGYVKRLFEPRRWYELVPDQSHSVVVAGNGTFTADGSPLDSDYLTAARTPDGSLVLAYLPTVRQITVDMSQLAAPAKASWYDPSRGTFAAIEGSPLANSGAIELTPPGPNRDGDGDWVLVLEVD